MWQDEFNGNSIDNSKWFVADWVSAKTQFTPNNVRFSNGLLYLRINRGAITSNPTTNTNTNTNSSSGNLALSGAANQSSTAHGGNASRAFFKSNPIFKPL